MQCADYAVRGLCRMQIIQSANYAVCRLCRMQIMPYADYAVRRLYSMQIIQYANYVACVLCIMCIMRIMSDVRETARSRNWNAPCTYYLILCLQLFLTKTSVIIQPARGTYIVVKFGKRYQIQINQHQMVKNGKNVGKMHKNDEINLKIYVLFTKFVV